MDVLLRPAAPDVALAGTRTPWQTHFSDLPAAPRRGGLAQVAPIAIPVIGSRPIHGRRLVRAPWAEPLAAFAGVVVETQLVPEAWLRPRSAARRAMAPAVPVLPGGTPRPFVVIPIVTDAAPPDGESARGRLIPFPVARVAPAEPRASALPRPVVSAVGIDHAAVPVAAAAPIEPIVPQPSTRPAAARRGFLGRAVALTAGLIVSLVAFEVAARVGRR